MRSVRGSSKGWVALKSKKKREKKTRMRCYEKREDNLLKSGFSSYVDYLASDQWKIIRQRKLQRYRSCLVCGEVATQVHHLSYDRETLSGLKDYRLVQLCRSCHVKIEFADGEKRNLKDANRALFELASQTERGQKWILYGGHQKRKKR